ncbi:hypothetical protein RND61_30395 [Streptomyces sp. TRM76323]|uniref:Secreted protein n=1 Tax=Streptomyces tamarix TaxID=3078565 RepID=A0ABU3QU78_9ACTN|nr:hypothetical protein [Streptomyces tamarix]MDT9686348.1 hypothetical protein [Streptomyces tamarix]
MKFISRLLVAGAVAGTAVLAVTTTGGAGTQSVAPVADEAPGYAVEDFNYPQADKILAEQGIKLKRGDGHITLATCGDPTLLEVWARSKEKICFRVTGNQGYLSLEIPAVYGVKGNAYNADVTMTVDNEEKSFEVPKNTWTPVGESADPEGRDHMLLEIVTSK